MNGRKIAYLTKVVLLGHVLNAPWAGRLKRRRRRGEVTRKAVLDYLQPYVPAVRNVAEDPAVPKGERRVFSVWLQGETAAPPLVRACLDSIRSRCGVEFVLLDGNTLFDWIDLPEDIVRKWKEGRMKAAHFIDICRLELLYRYGGVWMDATDYLDAPLPDWLWEQDFFVYRSGNTLRGFYCGIQNCFIRSGKGSYLLKAWREAVLAYWAREDSTVDYFVHQLLFMLCVRENDRCARLFASMPQLEQDPTHVLWYQHADAPYDEALLHSICAEALFQKTDYKSAPAANPVPGSFADRLTAPYR